MSKPENWQKNSNEQSGNYHAGSVSQAESGYEFLGSRLFDCRILHKSHYPCRLGVFRSFGCPYLQGTVKIDTARADLIPLEKIKRTGFTRKSRAVNSRTALNYYSVNCNTLSRTDKTDIPHLYFRGRNTDLGSVSYNGGGIGAKRRKALHRISYVLHGRVLKHLAYSRKEGYCHSLKAFPKPHCTKAGNGHKHVLVKKLSADDPRKSLCKNGICRQHEGGGKQSYLYKCSLIRHKRQQRKRRNGKTGGKSQS